MTWKRKLLRITGITLLAVLVLIILLSAFVYFNTERRIDKIYSVTVPELNIPSDSLSIEKGRHVMLIRGCSECHGENLGGKKFLEDPSLAMINAPNLTRGKGGLPADYSTSDWTRTLKHGVDRNGNALFIMPSDELSRMSDEDMANLIAYCQQVAPVDNELPRLHQLGIIGRVLLVLDKAPILPAEKVDHSIVSVPAKTVSVSADYGKYLSVGCEGCHRANMQGGPPLAPGFPIVPDITSKGNPGKWTKEQFIQTLRTGIRPNGVALNQEMPWQITKNFTDAELEALFMYLQSLPVQGTEIKP